MQDDAVVLTDASGAVVEASVEVLDDDYTLQLKPAELRQLLFDTAGDNPGQGVVDAAAAVERAGEDRPTKLH